jgi:hypothetical protein
LSIPTAAPHRDAAEKLLEDLESPEAQARLRAAYVDMLATPNVHGERAPAFLTPGR